MRIKNIFFAHFNIEINIFYFFRIKKISANIKTTGQNYAVRVSR